LKVPIYQNTLHRKRLHAKLIIIARNIELSTYVHIHIVRSKISSGEYDTKDGRVLVAGQYKMHTVSHILDYFLRTIAINQ